MIKLGLFFLNIMAFLYTTAQYNKELVEKGSALFEGKTCSYIKIKNENVKAKYILANPSDKKNGSVYQIFNSWSKGKNIITFFSGNYMNNCDPSSAKPLGLSIWEGNLVNNNLLNSDALIRINQSGNLIVENIKSNNLYILDDKNNARSIDIKNPIDLSNYIKWCKSNSSSLFQTHLLVKNNQILVSSNSPPYRASRKFLVQAIDTVSKNSYYIIFRINDATLYESVSFVSRLIIDKQGLEIISMINLDTGCNDVYQEFNSDGDLDKNISSGIIGINQASNLIVFYLDNQDFGFKK